MFLLSPSVVRQVLAQVFTDQALVQRPLNIHVLFDKGPVEEDLLFDFGLVHLALIEVCLQAFELLLERLADCRSLVDAGDSEVQVQSLLALNQVRDDIGVLEAKAVEGDLLEVV